ncbi:hypothetical protein ACQP1K_13395 [Sphaerimonospora sp. CA-214678]|uniref:hypothetical protein n=1 Tax=Sphaerimonospora sp. CA-214678 TaxID=3240029 RepID=UPI003D8E7AAC
MHVPRPASVVAALVSFAACLAVPPLMSAPASAGVTAPSAVPPLGNAPSCIAVWQRTGNVTKTGYARNDCGNRMNIKIIWAHGADGPCRSLAPGQTLKHKIPRGPRNFDGASTC